MCPETRAQPCIEIRGARQNNLRDLTLQLPLGQLLVVAGVSGAGKSSLVFDTLYAEGQRRYVETFSAYARQFLDRMDRPDVDAVSGIPPAIAIEQGNSVRTSRSTVGTLTEINDYLKLLYARAATLYCPGCGQEVHSDHPASVADRLLGSAWQGVAVAVCFGVEIPEGFHRDEVVALLGRQGYTRFLEQDTGPLRVVQDRLRLAPTARDRLVEALEAAMREGQGRCEVWPLGEHADQPAWRFSSGLHCAGCDREFRPPRPSLFSFNSPLGACPACRGFGRVQGIDYRRVIPDPSLSLAGGAVRPWQSPSYAECQDDLLRHAVRRGIPTQRPWADLDPAQQAWVIDGEGPWEDGQWYGVRRFFDWLEGRSYRMHVRVLLSRYRSYDRCPECDGARLREEGLYWRLGGGTADQQALTIHALQCLALSDAAGFLDRLQLPGAMDQGGQQLLAELRTRMHYLVEVGVGYLTLDRQARTLSGGELQRINLTTALGTALVNTLFVLDEPTAGLHPRDVGRIIAVMQRLRDAGNSVIAVEHDPQVMRAADTLLELGPGPGSDGGGVVYQGPASGIRAARTGSITGDYLAGRRSVSTLAANTEAPDQWLTLRGARLHNLADLDVRIPLQRMVCVTGVSGSGKSTLVTEVLYPALAECLGGGPRGAADVELHGHAGLAAVVLVDQQPIGKTTRSNPASYVGVLDPIRKLYARLPLAAERGYGPGTFSFNSGDGRCPACAGNGFEHVEMQFLSDVYLRCAECDGRRYRGEVLDVALPGADGTLASIAEVLEMTVSAATGFFADQPAVLRGLEPLRAMGLGYLRLGQPVPTLSGGEAQRLKLAQQLASAARGRPTLFLLDEPTSGLHLEDVRGLLEALRTLLEQGHSLLIVEHHLDVIRSADWVIDLGPEGGEGGGRLVVCGPPAAVADCDASHTGAALRAEPGWAPETAPLPGVACMQVRGAREHNLRAVDVDIPRDVLCVVSGVSGSGKSTLAFDVVFAEGQRRYLESINAYARQFVQPGSRPEVDALLGVPPTVAIEQRTSRGGQLSTVGTLTEIYHYLRLLYLRLGVQHCPDCQCAVQTDTPLLMAERLAARHAGAPLRVYAPLVVARKGHYAELATWAQRHGHAVLRVDGHDHASADWPALDRYREHDIDLPVAEWAATPEQGTQLLAALEQGLRVGRGRVRVVSEAGDELLSTARSCPGCGRGFGEPDPRLFSFNTRHGACVACAGSGLEGEDGAAPCAACEGSRLRPEARWVRLQGVGIAELSSWSVERAAGWLAALDLDDRAALIARDPLAEARERIGALRQLGLGYLTLDRAAPTLSGGEAQRLRLAAQLGSTLRGVCYVLDEPTIGLHPRDNARLLDTLRRLRDKGNSVLVVEHDEDTLRAADHLIDLGPGAGVHGGRVVVQGDVATVAACAESITGRCLAQPPAPRAEPRACDGADWLRLRGARLHNLRRPDLRLPRARLVCISGVSGSGKSTLIRQVLEPNLRALVGGERDAAPAHCTGIEGWKGIRRVVEVDQTPIGRTPRSCPATYVGVWDRIRALLAATPEARMRGFGAGRFSFNTRGGRCESCDGQGVIKLEMNFLPDVTVACDACGGLRFDAETLAVRYRGHNAGEILGLGIAEARTLFAAQTAIARPLQLLEEVGLGYLSLGQRSPTLSGGEAQRLKLVTELAGADKAGETLYLLDEPTIGLHMADVQRLIDALQGLVSAGHSVVVIEHNLDVVAAADWVVDLGPEGGDGGGQIVASGPPQQLAASDSVTGHYLAAHLARRR